MVDKHSSDLIKDGYVELVAKFNTSTPSSDSNTIYNYNEKHQGIETNQIISIKFVYQQQSNGWQRLEAWKYTENTWKEILNSTIPVFTYSGSYQIVSDGDTLINQAENYTGENWKIRLLTSGNINFSDLRGAANGIDVFLVGGGGGGGNCVRSGADPVDVGAGGGGGGGGFTKTFSFLSLDEDLDYGITVGGASAAAATGNSTTAFGQTANGGNRGGNASSVYSPGAGGTGGTNGGKGIAWGASASSANNQGIGYYEFNSTSGKVYGKGGAGGGHIHAYRNPIAGAVNTGDGGGGQSAGNGNNSDRAGGGSGIVIIRNHRS